MSVDEKQPLESGYSLKLQVLPLVYAVASIGSAIVTAMYASGVAFFAAAGDGRAAAVTMVAASGALALTVGTIAATYGITKRAEWSWYLAGGIALVWTANGVRVVIRDGLTLPTSLVFGFVVLWMLWVERAALGVDAEDPVQWLRS